MKDLASQLDLNWSDIKFVSITSVYIDECSTSKEDFIAAKPIIKFTDSAPKELTN